MTVTVPGMTRKSLLPSPWLSDRDPRGRARVARSLNTTMVLRPVRLQGRRVGQPDSDGTAGLKPEDRHSAAGKLIDSERRNRDFHHDRSTKCADKKQCRCCLLSMLRTLPNSW